MKILLFTIFDEASGLYNRPFSLPSPSAAIRTFSDIACDVEHEIGKHPEDYSLYMLGEFDDNTAEFRIEKKSLLTTALECRSDARNINSDEQLDLKLSAGGTA